MYGSIDELWFYKYDIELPYCLLSSLPRKAIIFPYLKVLQLLCFAHEKIRTSLFQSLKELLICFLRKNENKEF